MIFHENCLPADNSHEISCLICYFWKSSKIWTCRLLQLVGGALWVKVQVPMCIQWRFSTCWTFDYSWSTVRLCRWAGWKESSLGTHFNLYLLLDTNLILITRDIVEPNDVAATTSINVNVINTTFISFTFCKLYLPHVTTHKRWGFNVLITTLFCKVYLQYVIANKKWALNVINTTFIFSHAVGFISSM